MEEAKKAETRYVGIDLAKRTYQVAIAGKKGKAVLSNGKTCADGRAALYGKLRPGDMVALEAGNMAFIMAKEIGKAVGCRVYVLNPSQLAVIYRSMKKTDKEDALKLAHILEDCREERLPTVALPGDREMLRRKLLAASGKATSCRTAAINRLHALFVSQGITTVAKRDLAAAAAREATVKRLTGFELEEAWHLVEGIALYEKRIAELDARIGEESAGDEGIERLQTVPGVGPKISFAFASRVAAERFENASQVSNFLGLVPWVSMSGETSRYGRITKRGNGQLRALLVQGAWSLVRSKNGGCLKARYEYMTKVKGVPKKKAIVAVARRLAELLYVLLRDGTSYEARPFAAAGQSGAALAGLALVA